MKKIILFLLLLPFIAMSQQPTCGTFSSGSYQTNNNNTTQSTPVTNSCSVTYNNTVRIIYAANFIKLQTGFHAGPFTGTGCFKTSKPLAYTVTQNQSVSCYGGSNGSATITVTGGAPSYTYSWSCGGNTSSITNKPSNTYYCTVTDAGGLSLIATVTITQPQQMTIGYQNTIYSCSPGLVGTVSINVTGGTSPYSCSDPYYSSGTYTRLPGGPYTFTITDAHNCNANASLHITNYKINNVTFVSDNNANYYISTVKTDGNTTFTRVLDNNYAGGGYWVNSKNSWDKKNNWNLESITYFDKSTPPVQYIQYPGNVFVTTYVNTISASSITGYTISDDQSFCDSYTWPSKSYSSVEQIPLNNSELTCKIYPNPSNGNFSINYTIPKDEIGTFEVYDMQGQKLFTKQLIGGYDILTINEFSFSAGIYYYKMFIGDKQIVSDKIVIIDNSNLH